LTVFDVVDVVVMMIFLPFYQKENNQKFLVPKREITHYELKDKMRDEFNS